MRKNIFGIAAILTLLFCLSVSAFATDTEESETLRYTVIVLDTSSSSNFELNGTTIYTADTAIEYVKAASQKLLSDVISADGHNYVAVVSYKSTASVVSDFTEDTGYLKEVVNSLTASDTVRDISAGLKKADELLSVIPNGENIKKNVVLFTTGMTNNGSYSYKGIYDETTVGGNWRRNDTQVRLYAYANYAISTAEALKAQSNLYVIGLFQTMKEMPEIGNGIAEFFQLTASNLATSSDYFYSVDDPNKLEFTFGDVAKDIIDDNELRRIFFNYNGSDTTPCYFTKEYFSETAYAYNQSLGTMSLALAWSAFGVKDSAIDNCIAYQNSYKNAKKLMVDIGMDESDIKAYGYTAKPTTDSIAAIFGNMSITVDNENYTLIAIAIRGGGYEQEWASNFTIGTTGNHDGFDTAKDNVMDYLKSYINEQGITGQVKFWITGYSRAAATANLVAGQLDHDLWISHESKFIDSCITYDYDDIYAYCFETPAGASAQDNGFGLSCYKNIFNIINSSDPVPYVAPATFGFNRYGIDKYLPSAESDSNYARYNSKGEVVGGKLYKMLQVYKKLRSDEYVVDDFQMKKLNMEVNVNLDWFNTSSEVTWIHDDTYNNYSQGAFLSNYVTILAKDFFKNRKTYVATYQDEIREICSVAFGCTDNQLTTMVDSLIKQATNNYKALVWSYFYNTGIRGIWFWNWDNVEEREDEALSIVSGWLNTAIQEAGITGYDENEIDAAGKDLGDLALALISNHPNYFTTAVCNGNGLGTAHYPELCFAWMASMDKNYSSSNYVSFNNGSYRVIHINCEVDVNIKDETNNTVASIKNEKLQEIADSSIISTINENSEKIIILPVDKEYNMEIIGRIDDNVNISIVEYCASAGDFTRSINYFDINLDSGDILNGTLPAYTAEELENGTPEGSEADYVLKNSRNMTVIPCNVDLSGKEATMAYYEVTVTSGNDSYGYAVGNGIYQYGNFAQIEAFSVNGYKFVGWFDGQSIVSTDNVYRFCVTSDKTLIANFEKERTYTSSASSITYDSLSFETNGGSDISRITSKSGTVIDLTKYVPFRNGYIFNGWYLDREFTNAVTSVKITKNTTVYAKWEKETDKNPFVDIKPADYFYDAVLWATESNITNGIDSTHFGPNFGTTRAQVVTFLWRTVGCPEPIGNEKKFTDVEVGSYYEKAVEWGAEQKVTKGTSSTTFSPNEICTRAQIVTFLARFAGVEDVDTTSVFTDVLTSDYFASAVKWAKDNGVTDGTSTNTFSPKQDCLRSQVVTFLYRWMVK